MKSMCDKESTKSIEQVPSQSVTGSALMLQQNFHDKNQTPFIKKNM